MIISYNYFLCYFMNNFSVENVMLNLMENSV